ncbi:MAG TPA: PEP/pyruvate-binding domain-containing protein [Candidatus Dormibacteraeota bacterium]|nr:PEP/pyruvate-binding domain-containing protein [Candidatus Dormibacteraeota bacterium]
MVRPLSELRWGDRELVGVKAAALGELLAAGFPVPAGFVLTTAAQDRLMGDDLMETMRFVAAELGDEAAAVRSSAVAEDLPGASFAGLYETMLGVRGADAIRDAVKRCWASAAGDRARAYTAHAGKQRAGGMAVLIQRLVAADSAGVAFTANPMTGARGEIVINAVRGLGEKLVSGRSVGDEWIVQGNNIKCTRSDEAALTPDQALAVADLARRVELKRGQPQDIEWALSGGRIYLLQARPMTALPEAVDWTPPVGGGWMRNFRYGEWLPDPVTPLFETWVLPRIDRSLIAAAAQLSGIRTPGPTYVIVNGWCFANPAGRSTTVGFLLRSLAVPRVMRALALQFTQPAIADGLIVKPLEKRWRDDLLPRYRALVTSGDNAVATSDTAELMRLVDSVADLVGEYFITFNFVGGSAWRLEAGLARFYRRNLWPVIAGTHQDLLCGLEMGDDQPRPHLVQSLDWISPTLGELALAGQRKPSDARKAKLRESRAAAETRCRAALANRPKLLRQFEELLSYAQRYAILREEQCADLTLGWPVIRRAAIRLGELLRKHGVIDTPEDVFFVTNRELTGAIDGGSRASLTMNVAERRSLWERQRKLAPPLLVGRMMPFFRKMLESNLESMRTPSEATSGAIRGLPASPGRASGPVRVIRGQEDFGKLLPGDVLVTQAPMPAWTPLFAQAVALITDTGTVAAHASLIAREIGIPAVVGTGDATVRLRDGEVVIVDGAAGLVEVEQNSVAGGVNR